MFFRRNRGERWLQGSAFLVLAAAFVLALPAFLVPLGLPPEGDAVDYRIPLVRWILRHRVLPDWPWSMVDDYPLFGELLMVPLYALHASLARLVPLAGYFGLAAAGGALTAFSHRSLGWRPSTLFLLGAAWVVALRPVAIQSNLLLIDNVAAACLVGSLAALLYRHSRWAALLAAAAMATRYTTWATAFFLALLCFWLAPKERRWREFACFCLLASIGPLPFMIRNFLLNQGHPFFPLDAPEVLSSVRAGDYGRGSGILAFVLLPWDLLVTNTFVRGIFDYTLGTLFYVQLFFAAPALVGVRIVRAKFSRASLATLAFALFHLIAWFASSQQLRFLTPSLVVFDLWMLGVLLRARPPPALVAFVTLVGLFSVLSVQKDSVLLMLGKKSSLFEARRLEVEQCFQRAGVAPSETVGFTYRNGVLGFFDQEFLFLPGHPYGIAAPQAESPLWVLDLAPRSGYEPWPKEAPCLLRRVSA